MCNQKNPFALLLGAISKLYAPVPSCKTPPQTELLTKGSLWIKGIEADAQVPTRQPDLLFLGQEQGNAGVVDHGLDVTA